MDETKPMTQNVGGRFLKKTGRDFPGGSVVKTLPSNAGDTGLIPGQGSKIPRASGATKPLRHS